MHILIGRTLIVVGVIFITFGLISILRFRSFYPRILISSEVDTVGMICIFSGIMIKNGFSFFSMKVFLVLLSIVFVGPIMTHYIARAGYYSDNPIKKEENGHDS